jgi:hypothetical protein
MSAAPLRACGGPGCEAQTPRRYCSRRCNYRAWQRARRQDPDRVADDEARRLEIETHRAERPAPASAPCGRWPTQAAAAEALRARMLRDGGWWGPPMVRAWATTHGLTEAEALELLRQLLVNRTVTLVGERDLPRWRAR